jgi:hypothetical protein
MSNELFLCNAFMLPALLRARILPERLQAVRYPAFFLWFARITSERCNGTSRRLMPEIDREWKPDSRDRVEVDFQSNKFLRREKSFMRSGELQKIAQKIKTGRDFE